MNKIVTLIIGIAAVVIGIIILITHFTSQAKQTAETTATVIRIESRMETDTDGEDTRYYYPIIEYTVNNQKYEQQLPDSGSTISSDYKEGDKIEVTYNPDNPNEISKKGSFGGLIAGIFFIIIGIIAVLSIFRM